MSMSMGYPGIKLLPCGHSIGVNILRKNFKIVDLSPVMKPNGIYYYPARYEDLRVNDIILEVEGQEIMSRQDLCKIINEASKVKQSISLRILRHNEILVKQVKPYFSPQSKRYKLGIVLNALDVGIGTLTFIDPITKKFGALAHFLGNLPESTRGTKSSEKLLVSSTISSIQKGRADNFGKKIGYLNRNSEFTGTIENNCQSGIFGTIFGKIESPYFDTPIPVSPKKQIRREKAYFYTVVHGHQIEKFELRVSDVLLKDQSNHDMRIILEDQGLIERTGGIIQGMSGSPIIQNEKLIGAVSYLSRSNSLCGFAVSLENMLNTSGLRGHFSLNESS